MLMGVGVGTRGSMVSKINLFNRLTSTIKLGSLIMCIW